MTLSVVQDNASFHGLRNEWNTLLSESSANTIFLTWEWLYEWWTSYAQSERLLILTLRDQADRLIGIAPLYQLRVRRMGFLPVKVLRFIGDGSGDSEYLDFIVANGMEEEARSAFFAYLKAHPALWDVLSLHGIPARSETKDGALEWAQHNGYRAMVRGFVTAFIPLPGSWSTYLTTLDRKFRWKVRSRLDKLCNNHKVEMVRCENSSVLQPYLDCLFDLHRKRWAKVYQDGCFVPARRLFYQRMGDRFLQRGWLQFYMLKVDGKVLAAQFGFQYGNKFYSLQEGLDPDGGQESYGIVLRAFVLQEVIRNGIPQYDLLRGDSDYKTRWNTTPTTCCSMELGRWTVPAVVTIYGPVMRERLLNWARAVAPARVLAYKRQAQQRVRRKRFLLKTQGARSLTDKLMLVWTKSTDKGVAWIVKRSLWGAAEILREGLYQRTQVEVWKYHLAELPIQKTVNEECTRVYDKAQTDMVVDIMSELEWYRNPLGIIRRLESGDVCSVTYAGSTPASFSWICTGSRYIDHAQKRLTLDAGEFCTYDVFTFPGYRNRGLASQNLITSLWYMRSRNYHTAYIDTSGNNVAMRRILEAVGYHQVQRIIRKRILGFRFFVNQTEREIA
jgi:CelD/BcsL family acetyltransferase involved in cellulose biosynthesis